MIRKFKQVSMPSGKCKDCALNTLGHVACSGIKNVPLCGFMDNNNFKPFVEDPEGTIILDTPY